MTLSLHRRSILLNVVLRLLLILISFFVLRNVQGWCKLSVYFWPSVPLALVFLFCRWVGADPQFSIQTYRTLFCRISSSSFSFFFFAAVIKYIDLIDWTSINVSVLCETRLLFQRFSIFINVGRSVQNDLTVIWNIYTHNSRCATDKKMPNSGLRCSHVEYFWWQKFDDNDEAVSCDSGFSGSLYRAKRSRFFLI